MKRIPAVLALLGAVIATPAVAQDDVPPDLAESRLRGCLLAGASAAPATNLQSAVVSVRSFCGAQIKRVRTHRVDAATAGLDGEAAKRAAEKATRDLNNEIALAIANFTGLTS